VSSKHPQRDRKRSRLTVRVGPFERTLENMNQEMGQKVAYAITQYDRLKVKPMRDRLDWLEKLLVVRVWLRCRQAWTWLYSGRAWARLKLKFNPPPPPIPEEPVVASVSILPEPPTV